MSSRRDIFANGHFYHVFNKTIDHKNIFDNKKLCELFMELIFYYRSLKSNIRFSHYKELTEDDKQIKKQEIKNQKYFKLEILTYCLMSNHFHLLVKQKNNNGIVRFMSDIVNSLTRYSNTLNKRIGPIFLPQFKSRMITSREQLIHVSRYIHLNPYSSELVNSTEELITYPYSSLKEYLLNKSSICNTEPVLQEFGNSKKRYKEFVISNAEHQKMLDFVKYMEKWS